MVHTTVATWSNDAEESVTRAMKSASKTHTMLATTTLAERAIARGSATWLLGVVDTGEGPDLGEDHENRACRSPPRAHLARGHAERLGQHCGFAPIGHANDSALRSSCVCAHVGRPRGADEGSAYMHGCCECVSGMALQVAWYARLLPHEPETASSMDVPQVASIPLGTEQLRVRARVGET